MAVNWMLIDKKNKMTGVGRNNTADLRLDFILLLHFHNKKQVASISLTRKG